jgi:uncharacterized protein YneF (UPF0154 family)
MTYSDGIEKLAIYFSGTKYKDEIVDAKKHFFSDVGIDDKESERYERWMNIFFDWYLFTRPVTGTSLPPAQFALEIDEFQQLPTEEKDIFINLAKCEHSLLEFIKTKGDFVYFKDIFRRKKVKVVNHEFVLTLEKGDICDTRLIPYEDSFVFSKGFCCHPLQARRFILKEAKKLKKSPPAEQQEFQIMLVRMFFKMEQYSHLKVEQIYTRESKVRF